MGDEVTGGYSEVTVDGFTVGSNRETAEELEANLTAEAAPKDGKPESPEEAERKRVAKAAKELGKRGGEAAAKAREKVEPAPKTEAKPKGEEPPVKATEGETLPEPKRLGHPRDDPRARVEKATRELAEERRARQQLEERLAELEGKAAPVKEPAKDAKPEARQKPKPEAFETYEEYIEALADFKAEQRVAKDREERENEARAGRAEQMIRERAKTMKERMDAAVAADPMVKDRLDPALMRGLLPTWALPPGETPDASNDLAAAIIESEEAVGLLLHLSENPDEYERILSLPNSAAVGRAVGHLEAKLATERNGNGEPTSKEAPPKPAPKPVSKAEPPVRPVSGGPTAGEDLGADASFEEHVRFYNAKDERARRGRA